MPDLYEKVQIVGVNGQVVAVDPGGIMRTTPGAVGSGKYKTRKVMIVGTTGSVAGVTGSALDTSGG